MARGHGCTEQAQAAPRRGPAVPEPVDHLRFMYHMSGYPNRDSILEHGLDWSHCAPDRLLGNDDGEGGLDWPRGQYFFPEYPDEAGEEDDVYRVDTAGLTIYADPFHEAGVAYYTLEPIGLERLTYLGPPGYDVDAAEIDPYDGPGF
jgi:hypothetical protein